MNFDVITDHKPVVTLYNNPKRQGPARVERHRLKLQAYRFTVKYEKGTSNPADFNSRHPLQMTHADEEEGIEETQFVNAIVSNNVPDALTEHIIQKATNEDTTLSRLKYCILKTGYIPETAKDLAAYRAVFGELSVANQVVLRGTRIVLPQSLQPTVIELAH
ncbi:uncharacterized protein LOC130648659 [Hydractinia symbiolongicarpus]|uniref:uncharacterized protein LOC130648659 n=1 Tax=Hydractinia symbiolongicarpus TaxID=13093 RepID=UPI00254CA600|nr:uncharacterized protein LOC130648659 [Hydractinia symbiolongicarpus]